MKRKKVITRLPVHPDLDWYLDMLVEYDARTDKPCVYFLLHGDQLIYIGKTKELGPRLKSHRRKLEYDRVFFMPMGSMEAATVIESAFIAKCEPPKNINNPMRMNWMLFQDILRMLLWDRANLTKHFGFEF